MSLQTEAEKRYIKDLFDDLLKSFNRPLKEEDIAFIEKAFHLANQAHMGIRRKSGEPYIVHPLAVAKIVAHEIGLGTKAVVSAILHDVVEDTDYTLEDMSNLFGPKIASIVDGLTKLSGSFDSKQAANFRKMLLTLSEDVRVILVKIADRLHNMRTLESMPPHKQMKIAGETLYVFAPLAHRLGLYSIKTELEDLSLKYKDPKLFEEIKYQLHNQEEQRAYLVDKFCAPIQKKLKQENINFTISGRPKSIYSIWNKMQNKGVTFDQIYDILAIRIIFTPNNEISEKRQCFDILSLVTDIYKPKPDRIRDWITLPKANGYEALHVTVMGPGGKWVEVQIRTDRMNEIAERGFAAHYKYKGGDNDRESELDKWLGKIQELLKNPESDALDFLDDFKLNLFSHEILVFTPKGDMITLPLSSTVLDLAYEIHTDLGNKCIGAKVNHKLVPLNQKLNSGDQIEIITSSKQTPRLDWLDIVITAKAKSKIKDSFKSDRKKHIEEGRKKLEAELQRLNFKPSSNTLRKIINFHHLHTKDQLYAEIGISIIPLSNLQEILEKKSENKFVKYWKLNFQKKKGNASQKTIDKKKPLLLDGKELNYQLGSCCNPIPGDDVLGYIQGEEIIIHKKECPQVEKLLVNEGDQIISAEWTKYKALSYLSHLHIQGIDRMGMLHDITDIISNIPDMNIRSAKFDGRDGIFEGELFLYVQNTEVLDAVQKKIMNIKGVDSVKRVDSFNKQ